MPHAVWHHQDVDEQLRARLRELGRAYRDARDADKAARKALEAVVIEALRDKEPVGEIAREAGFDREWVRRARVAAEQAGQLEPRDPRAKS